MNDTPETIEDCFAKNAGIPDAVWCIVAEQSMIIALAQSTPIQQRILLYHYVLLFGRINSGISDFTYESMNITKKTLKRSKCFTD